MCNICTAYSEKSESFDCPKVTEWPDDPMTTEQRIKEDHDWARFVRKDPEAAERFREQIVDLDCDHRNTHKMVQTWQGTDVLCQVCDACAATKTIFQFW